MLFQKIIFDANDEDEELESLSTTLSVEMICQYYSTYIYKKPCMDSFQT